MISIDPRRVRVTLLPGEPGLFVTDPNGEVARDAERRLSNMDRASRRFVRVRSGKLLSTIRKRMSFTKHEVRADLIAGGGRVRYTLAEHDGTIPHEIRARRRKSLRFMVAGRIVFRRRVWHPGTKGSHFLTRALPFGSR